jgi:hypothetical protein
LVGLDGTVSKLGGRHATRVELQKKETAAFFFVVLAQLAGGHLQAQKTKKKSDVAGMTPPDEPRTLPAVRAQCIESPVVTDPKSGIALDRITSTSPARPPNE